MNRIQLACYCLLASAFVLAALLVVNLDGQLASPAHAAMAVQTNNATFITAQTREGEEALFVLDNLNNRLLIYTTNVGRGQIELVGGISLNQLFRGGNAPAPQQR